MKNIGITIDEIHEDFPEPGILGADFKNVEEKQPIKDAEAAVIEWVVLKNGQITTISLLIIMMALAIILDVQISLHLIGMSLQQIMMVHVFILVKFHLIGKVSIQAQI